MINGFSLDHDKSLQIYLFCVKRHAKHDFLKDVESLRLRLRLRFIQALRSTYKHQQKSDMAYE